MTQPSNLKGQPHRNISVRCIRVASVESRREASPEDKWLIAKCVPFFMAINFCLSAGAQQSISETASAPAPGAQTNSTTRISEKWDFAMEGGGGGTESYAIGGDDAMCRQMLLYKNESLKRGAKYCNSTARLFIGFSTPPWSELDPHQHRALVSRLLRYDAEGPARYFDRTTVPERRSDADTYYLKLADKFIADGGRVQMWRTTPYDPSVEDINKLTAGASILRNLIQLRGRPQKPAAHKAACTDSMDYFGIFFVTSDLEGPDPNVTDGFRADRTIFLSNRGERILLREDPDDVEFLREDVQTFRRACHLVRIQVKN